MSQDLAVAIDAVARELARSLPPPRDAPYFWLDAGAAYDLRVLDGFLTHGIFRKYEFALDLGSGLGGRARWLARRSGCRVLGVDARLPVVAAASALNRRAHLDNQVMFQVGTLGALPLRERVFTHVWLVDASLQRGAAEALPEALRVLRRGGHFALQCAQTAEAEPLYRLLRDIGFVELHRREVAFVDLPHACQVAAERLGKALDAKAVEDAAWRECMAPPGLRAGVQIFGRRPA